MSRAVIVSMGCSKNLVDSERLAAMMAGRGIDVVFDGEPQVGDDVVVNTCGFIGDAKEESIDMLLKAIALKQQGKVGRVFAMGCLSERYRGELAEEMPELDGLYGKFDWSGIADVLAAGETPARPWERRLSTAPHYTYIKISEGCNRFCAFCAIPLITGRHHSRAIGEIADEVRALVAGGVKEFNIIAQDLSAYGSDLGMAGDRSPLAELIDTLARIEGVEMLRLHYAYPAGFPYDILPVMASHPNVCKYLDIALQHIDDAVLANMRRHITAAETEELLARIRREVPGIHIRTTLMVGFPGEDEDAFERLMDFVRRQRFERMGAFAYCEEDDTYAARNLEDNIPEDVKQKRLDRLMALQQDIAFEHAAAKAGSEIKVIVDREEPDCYVGRSEFDSPEVDCNVLISKDTRLKPGDICTVHVDSSCGFDLTGHVVG